VIRGSITFPLGFWEVGLIGPLFLFLGPRLADAKAPNLATIEQTVEPALREKGFELIYAELGRVGGHSVLRLYIDKPGGITLADCEAASKELDPLLDAADFFPGRYTLEVSSPGVDRPLRPSRPSDFARFLGKLVQLEMRVPLPSGQRRAKGRLRTCEAEKITIQPEKGEALTLSLSEVKKANLIWEGEGPSGS
jgi:ribosome maturation factor RimP